MSPSVVMAVNLAAAFFPTLAVVTSVTSEQTVQRSVLATSTATVLVSLS